MIGVMGLLLAPAVAAPAGYSVVGHEDGCELSLGPTEDDGVVPMRAECRWPDEAPEALVAALSDPLGQDEIWSQILETRVWSGSGDRRRIWYLHDLPGFSDREVVVDWRREELDGGGLRTSWSTASVDFEPDPSHVRAARFEGSWTVRPLAEGGSSVVHETRYDPGSFPGWMVRPFLGRSVAGVVRELREGARVVAEAR